MGSAIEGAGQKLMPVTAAVGGTLLDDVEADSGGETEAGTTQRNVVRLGVVSIPVSFSVSPKWLKVLTEFKQREKIAVEYFDTETLETRRTEMFVRGIRRCW